MIRELAPAKVNLILHIGPRRDDGLHEICSLFASLELADRLEVEPAAAVTGDEVTSPGVEGPDLAAAALRAYRSAAGADTLPSLRVRVEKRIPVAAGLAGGSADAAAALRAADALASRPLGPTRLREIAMDVGADVPSQVEPGHALVTGAGERVEPVELPRLLLVLVPQPRGLSTARVYAELDRRGEARTRLDPARLRDLAASQAVDDLVSAVENDLEAAALALRPELAEVKRELVGVGARAAFVSGSGPTVAAIFERDEAARRAAARIEGAIVTGLRPNANAAASPASDGRIARAEPAGAR
jgi:4-diphosphocytidyl-2-C-methyl-D-erythritol kinase